MTERDLENLRCLVRAWRDGDPASASALYDLIIEWGLVGRLDISPLGMLSREETIRCHLLGGWKYAPHGCKVGTDCFVIRGLQDIIFREERGVHV